MTVDVHDQLKCLLPAELDDVVRILRIPPEYLTHPAAPATRALEIVRFLESMGRVDELERFLAARVAADAKAENSVVAQHQDGASGATHEAVGERPNVTLFLADRIGRRRMGARAFQPDAEFKRRHSYHPGEYLTGFVKTNRSIYLCIFHDSDSLTDQGVARVFPEHNPPPVLEPFAKGARLPTSSAALVLEGRVTHPLGMKHFLAYWSLDASVLLPVATVPANIEFDRHRGPMRDVFQHLDEAVASGQVYLERCSYCVLTQ